MLTEADLAAREAAANTLIMVRENHRDALHRQHKTADITVICATVVGMIGESPEAVLELVAEVRRLRTENERWVPRVDYGPPITLMGRTDG